ncbi:MAG: orotate phosphoribosyltransferase [Bacteroidetes bacterium]|nr:orotate phosphoribosyltransferase [Bacteroidota bacterium]
MKMNKEVAAKIAEYLLNIKAVKLNPENPYTWASGWKSPIYCDNRVLLSHPEVRTYVKESFIELIKSKFPQAEAIVGVATAGIAHGALIADEMNLPYAYVRPEPKKHGMGKQLEGDLKTGSKVVVIEDLLSTGKSSLAAIQALRSEGMDVLGMAAIFTYGFEVAQTNFRENQCEYFTLSNYDELLEKATSIGYINASQIESLNTWKTNPQSWNQ